MSDEAINHLVVEMFLAKLTDVNSLSSPEKYRSIIKELFDGEESLMDAAESIAIELMNTLRVSDTLGPRLQEEISKTVNKAILIGFLSERYSRDKVMDSSTCHGNTVFKRDYEDLPTYISRKLISMESNPEEIVRKAANKRRENEDTWKVK